MVTGVMSGARGGGEMELFQWSPGWRDEVISVVTGVIWGGELGGEMELFQWSPG